MIKVAKFGGSSLADAKQFKKVKDIILKDSNISATVVSAPGKRFLEDSKITDLLYLSYAHLKYSVEYEKMFANIENRYFKIKEDLNLNIDLEKEFNIIKHKMKKGMNKDYLISRGEYLNGKLLAEYLGYDFIDAKDIIFFNFNGQVNIDKTTKAIEKIFDHNSKVIIPGFYGSLPNGEIKVFSRGGSDITGAIVANIINASVYENWTDVSGILMADPRIVNNPKRIDFITYNELRELSYMGANVLHTNAVAPVKEANIPINIRNTNDPSNPGTMIVNNNHEILEKYKSSPITGIAGKKNFSILSIYKYPMSEEANSLLTILDALKKYKINIEHISSGIDNFSLVISSDKLEKNLYEIIADIKKLCNSIEVKVVQDISLIAIVGRNMVHKPGTSGKLFAAMGNENVNIRVISQSADELNIIIGVDNKDFEKCINVIYNNFIV